MNIHQSNFDQHWQDLVEGPAREPWPTEHGAPAPVRHSAAQGYAHIKSLRAEVKRLRRARRLTRLWIGSLTVVIVGLAVTAVILVARLAPAVL